MNLTEHAPSLRAVTSRRKIQAKDLGLWPDLFGLFLATWTPRLVRAMDLRVARILARSRRNRARRARNKRSQTKGTK